MIIIFPEQRRIEILDKIDKENSVKVDELAQIYKVTNATIRRDLELLEKEGYLKRTHGGAVINDDSKNELTFLQKHMTISIDKEKIGKHAATLVNEGDTIVIDASTTTIQMVKYIKKIKNINVITNSIDVTVELADIPGIQVISTGGIIRGKTRAMVGPVTKSVIDSLISDKAFIGANAIDIEHGIASTHVLEGEIKKAMINNTKQIIFMCESKKFNEVKMYKLCDLKHANMIITDDKIEKEVLNKYSSQVKIIQAK
ncbi:DeoR/GlpR family DNA-binding transcription regulator [Abyssisolibacter fermentans]|uniref:DeoR/GlpR family DNA-binding transcription regulator n=1 Tax=Abyssisolibacter fermentans TaxID=1766203 RepID=UPI0012E37F6E|nr:DeoR/GlpR family DNA-binding transcription regulator [Abyssisolibacter fermentans]